MNGLPSPQTILKNLYMNKQNKTVCKNGSCSEECLNGTQCFQITHSIARCSVHCRRTWTCDSPLIKTSDRMLSQSVNDLEPLITPEEFINAVKSAGYPEPNEEKFHNLVSQAESAGGITSKKELAMFLAQILWESDGLQAKIEYACSGPSGCPYSYKSSSDEPGKQYFGRGYIQLTYSGNYRAASYDLFKDDRLVKNPDLIAENDDVSWATAFWFWKTNVGYYSGVEQGKFGVTTKAINGALECSGSDSRIAKSRFKIYSKVLNAFNINEHPDESEKIFTSKIERLKSDQKFYFAKKVPQQWQIVGLLKSGDKKQNEIAKLLGVSPKSVSSTKKRYEETGSVSDRSRSGGPQKLTSRDENYIFREIRKYPTSSYQKLATDFNSKTQAVRISNASKCWSEKSELIGIPSEIIGRSDRN
ncbi:chitinase 4-like [Brachionus plicatilis]|uniref:Chitinase 4-like n=1 Tax=Brachionus plicatilis TaxID=10195 RepID=A0A3M7T257_BRAPC|nr:chitinase 4-like [Brachionus plicatilis]